MADRVRVAVLGACGKMGREVVKAVAGAPDMRLVGACDVAFAGSSAGEIAGVKDLNVAVESDFAAMLTAGKPRVVVDFAKPFSLANTRLALESGAASIIGTTGISAEDIESIRRLAQARVWRRW